MTRLRVKKHGGKGVSYGANDGCASMIQLEKPSTLIS